MPTRYALDVELKSIVTTDVVSGGNPNPTTPYRCYGAINDKSVVAKELQSPEVRRAARIGGLVEAGELSRAAAAAVQN